MREFLACVLHMLVESRPPRIEWMLVHPLTIRLAKSQVIGIITHHDFWPSVGRVTSWFYTCSSLVSKTLALLLRERMSMFPEILGKELSSIARRSFCFSMHSPRCRSRGNANEEVIVRSASRSELGRPLSPRCDFTMHARSPHVH